MRRRLWWTMVVLDMRAVEDRGTEAIVRLDSFNTRLPTNISDADFGPESCAIAEREGPTDVTFYLCMAMSTQFHMRMMELLGGGRPGVAATSFPQAEAEIIANVRRLESRFIDGADLTHIPSAIASRTMRLIILKVWLGIQYPVRVLPTHAGRAAEAVAVAGRPRVSHEDMLRTAIAVMELAEFNGSGPAAERCRWWYETYIQWHPLAVALAELCNQTEGELVARAWRVIDRVFGWWSLRVADSRRGLLWRPIRKLLKKARTARTAALMGALSIQRAGGGSGEDAGSSGPSEVGATVGQKSVAPPMGAAADQHPPMNPVTSSGDLSWAPPEFLNSDPDFCRVDFDSDPIGNLPDSMDWTTWNEFVSDAYADGELAINSFM